MLTLLITNWFLILTIVQTNRIVNITDSNIDEFYQEHKQQEFLLIFYVNNCNHSQNALEVLENFNSEDFPNILIAEIDCSYSIFNCMRFNITKVPTLFLFKANFLYEFNYHITDVALNYFLSNKHPKEKGVEFPNKKGILDLVIKLWEEGVKIITNYAQNLISTYTSSNLKWEKNYTIGGIIGITICIAILEIKVIIFFCLRRTKKVKLK